MGCQARDKIVPSLSTSLKRTTSSPNVNRQEQKNCAFTRQLNVLQTNIPLNKMSLFDLRTMKHLAIL